MAHGDLPVIVAGGVYSHEDIRRFLALGADGVQMGTRFFSPPRRAAHLPSYKQAVLRARPEDMVVANAPGSPCGLPFRVLRESPMHQVPLVRARAPRCSKGYVLFKDADGRFSKCPAKDDNDRFFCICEGLLSAAGYERGREEPLYMAGTTAARVNRILPTSDLMAELARRSGASSPGGLEGPAQVEDLNEKGPAALRAAGPFHGATTLLSLLRQHAHVGRLGLVVLAGALLERDCLTLVEGLKALALDLREVNEEIVAALVLDEAVTLFSAEPL